VIFGTAATRNKDQDRKGWAGPPRIIVCMNRVNSVFCSFVVWLAVALPAVAQSGSGQTPQQVPVIDGEAGPCSLELTVTGPDGKPVYAAKVKVHIAYGFGGFHKLDLEAGSNSDGKLKFTGLPARVHRPPLEFEASKDDLEGAATYDPSSECQSKHDVTMSKRKPGAQ
jgi:hypothetical protein